MKRIAIFAPTGMLGSAVYGVLRGQFELVLVVRDTAKIPTLEKSYGTIGTNTVVLLNLEDLYQEYLNGSTQKGNETSWMETVDAIGPVDGVINCLGVTNRYSKDRPGEAFFINGFFPHLLAATYGERLLHITTDCVYSGDAGRPYSETDIPSPVDLYGITKMLGEPSHQSLVIRTSIIGPEIAGFVSLIEWVKQQAGKEIHGYTNHLWNGITTKQFGNIALQIFSNRTSFPSHGLFHVYSTDVNKFEMVSAIAKKYQVDTTILPDDGPKLDRRLTSNFDLVTRLRIPPFTEMLNEL